jgi:hypothetical protein
VKGFEGFAIVGGIEVDEFAGFLVEEFEGFAIVKVDNFAEFLVVEEFEGFAIVGGIEVDEFAGLGNPIVRLPFEVEFADRTATARP